MIDREVPLSVGWRTVSQEDAPPPKRKPRGRGWLVAMQSAACAVLVLAALLLRAAGGESYTLLRDRFCESLARNDLLATLAALWDGEPSDMVESDLREYNDNAPSASGTAADGAPVGATTACLSLANTPSAPLSTGTLTSGYGYRQTVDGEEFHYGVDIAAPHGTPIAALFYGRVVTVGEERTLGRYIVLDHGGGVQVLYAHCAEIVAPQGAVVRGGETVALVGSTGDSTGDHVHIQVTGDGMIYDPSQVASVERYV